jgi:hypothetical protein
MFRYQLKRVKDNIIPFACIGLLVGIVIGKASWFRGFPSLNSYFGYAGINTYFPDSGQIAFYNHFSPDTLTFLLVAIFIFAGMTRLVLGFKERGPEDRTSVMQSLDNLGSLLAIAWVGLILGITIPVFIFQGLNSCAIFFVNIFYPLIFLIEVSLCTEFLAGPILDKIHRLIGNKAKLGTRVEGLVILGLGILILTFQGQHADTIDSFTGWITSML